jgi:hypothetical protein
MVPEICVALLMSVFPATSTVWADEPLAPCTSAVVEGADCSGSVRQPAILRLNHFGVCLARNRSSQPMGSRG